MLFDNIANFPNHRLKVVVIVSHRQTHAATVGTPSAPADQSAAGVGSHVTVSSRRVGSTRTSTRTYTRNRLRRPAPSPVIGSFALYCDYVTAFKPPHWSKQLSFVQRGTLWMMFVAGWIDGYYHFSKQWRVSELHTG